MTPDQLHPLEELTLRHRALRMAILADEAIRAGAPVTRITPTMIAEQSRQESKHKITPEARARAGRNGGLARALMFANKRREKEGCGI